MLAVVEGFGAHGSRTGKIHMQKALALVSEAAGVALPFSCVLYRHGPYSFDIAIELPAAPFTRKSATRAACELCFLLRQFCQYTGIMGRWQFGVCRLLAGLRCGWTAAAA